MKAVVRYIDRSAVQARLASHPWDLSMGQRPATYEAGCGPVMAHVPREKETNRRTTATRGESWPLNPVLR
ncbi:MAG: hypothetical protein ACJAQ3_003260 [Planctomycetota bacterium]|jgi:hypothetical protein